MADIIAPAAPTRADRLRNDVLTAARSTPDAIRLAEQSDPDLAAFLKGKAAIASKAIWGPPVSGAIVWLSTRYGLGWDADTVNVATGIVAVAVGMLARLVAKAPITGLFAAKPVAPAP